MTAQIKNKLYMDTHAQNGHNWNTERKEDN